MPSSIYISANITMVSPPIGVIQNVIRYYGEASVPRNIRRQRRNNLDTMRRFGSPIIVKHMYNDEDVRVNKAIESPNFSSVYGQTRHDDPLSHGVGFVGLDEAETEWVSPDGDLIVDSPNSPGPGYTKAPKYRGYGPGYLTYAILPDVSQDIFKLTEAGALIRSQQAQVQMGWFPQVNDNDLIVVCTVDNAMNVTATHERYQAKQTNPVSMRGLDRKGRKERDEDFGNRHVIDQNFEMTLVPNNDVIYNVEMDR
jgi:hypothetical protein